MNSSSSSCLFRKDISIHYLNYLKAFKGIIASARIKLAEGERALVPSQWVRPWTAAQVPRQHVDTNDLQTLNLALNVGEVW